MLLQAARLALRYRLCCDFGSALVLELGKDQVTPGCCGPVSSRHSLGAQV